MLFAPFVSFPFPVPVAQFTYVPVCVTRAPSPITRSTPGPSDPSEHCNNTPPEIEQLPFTGCCVTDTNMTPPGAASTSFTSCAWFGPLFLTRTAYATSAWPLTSCTCDVADLPTWTSMNSSVFTVGGAG